MNELITQKPEKGSFISGEELEKYIGAEIGSKKFAFGKMAIITKIEQTWGLHPKNEGDGIRILEDVDASEYRSRQFGQGLEKLYRTQFRMLSISTDSFSDAQKQKHDHSLTTQTTIITAIADVVKKIMPVKSPHFDRKIPKVLS